MPNYASLVGALILLSVFAAVYSLLPRARRAMLWTGLALAPAGPLSEWWFVRDYWQPTYLVSWKVLHWKFGVEDALFSFAFCGVAAGFYQWLSMGTGGETPPEREENAWNMTARGVVLLFLLFAGVTAIDWVSIYACMATFAILIFAFLVVRPTAVFPVVGTGLMMSGLMLVFYVGLFVPMFPRVFAEWFKHEFISGVTFLGVPVEEPAWAFFAGAFSGLVYPMLTQKLSLKNTWLARLVR